MNDFLPAGRRQAAFDVAVDGHSTVKDLIEGVGVPRPDIDRVLVGGVSVAFDCLVRPGDRVAVFPRFTSVDVWEVTRVRASPLEVTRFVANLHLGRLARHLRAQLVEVLRRLGPGRCRRSRGACDAMRGFATWRRRMWWRACPIARDITTMRSAPARDVGACTGRDRTGNGCVGCSTPRSTRWRPVPGEVFGLAADLVVVLHAGFVAFVLLGGLLALRWRRAIRVHLPAVTWEWPSNAADGSVR